MWCTTQIAYCFILWIQVIACLSLSNAHFLVIIGQYSNIHPDYDWSVVRLLSLSQQSDQAVKPEAASLPSCDCLTNTDTSCTLKEIKDKYLHFFKSVNSHPFNKYGKVWFFYVKYPCDYGVMKTRGGLRLTPITDYSSPRLPCTKLSSQTSKLQGDILEYPKQCLQVIDPQWQFLMLFSFLPLFYFVLLYSLELRGAI